MERSDQVGSELSSDDNDHNVGGSAGLTERVERDLHNAAASVSRWRREARTCDRFLSGSQWDPIDAARLDEEDRPNAVFNFAQKYVRIVAGVEKANRQEVVFVPRMADNPDTSAEGDLASAVYSAVIDGCNGPEERSAAFEDMLVRGMGWVNCRLDTELDPEGKIILERVDGLRMHWDPAARKQNLEDARWVACEEEIALSEACHRWPEHAREIKLVEFMRDGRQGANGGDFSDDGDQVEHVTPIEYQPENQTTLGSGPPKGFVRVTEYQYYDIEPVYRVADPLTNEVRELDAEQFGRLRRRLRESGIELRDKAETGSQDSRQDDSRDGSRDGSRAGERFGSQAGSQAGNKIGSVASEIGNPDGGGEPETIGYVRQSRRVYRRGFVAGRLLLESGRLPVQGVGFTYRALTGSYDAHEKIWRGLLHLLIDPQRFANKFFSQTLHIINSNAKGGIMAEATAFADPVRAEQDWANPSALILLEDGALSGPKPRIIERSRPSLPEGTFAMLKWCIDALGGVSGINPELLGSTTGDVPGVAQRQRQIQGMTINAGYFSALTRYLREEARLVFEFIRNYVADGRLVRIGGAYDSRALRLMREHLPVDYDLVIDEPTRSPNAREVFWDKMAPLLPMLIKSNAFVPEILDYSPMPASIASRIKQQLQARMNAAAAHPPMAPGMRGAGRSPAEIAAEIAQKRAAAELAMARARAVEAQTQNQRQSAAITAVSKLGAAADRHRESQLNQAQAVAGLLARHGRTG